MQADVPESLTRIISEPRGLQLNAVGVFQNEQVLICPDLAMGLVTRGRPHSLGQKPFALWENCSTSINLSNASDFLLSMLAYSTILRNTWCMIDTLVNKMQFLPSRSGEAMDEMSLLNSGVKERQLWEGQA